MLSRRSLEEHATGYRLRKDMADMGEVYERIGPIITHRGPVVAMRQGESYSFTLVDEHDAALRSMTSGRSDALRAELQKTRPQKLQAAALLGITSLAGAAIETPTGSVMRDMVGAALGAGVAGIGQFVKRRRHLSSIEQRLCAIDSRFENPDEHYNLSLEGRHIFLNRGDDFWNKKIEIPDGNESATYSPREILAWLADSIQIYPDVKQHITIQLVRSHRVQFLTKQRDTTPVFNFFDYETGQKTINNQANEFMLHRDSIAILMRLSLVRQPWPSNLDRYDIGNKLGPSKQGKVINKFVHMKLGDVWGAVYGRSKPVVSMEQQDVTFSEIVLPPGELVSYLFCTTKDSRRLWYAIQPSMSQLVTIRKELTDMEQSKKAAIRQALYTKTDTDTDHSQNDLAVIDERMKVAIQDAHRTNTANTSPDAILQRIRALEEQELYFCLDIAAQALHINRTQYHDKMRERFLDAMADTIAAAPDPRPAIEFAESVVNVYEQFIRGKNDASSRAAGERLLTYLQKSENDIKEGIQQPEELRAGLAIHFPQFDWQAASAHQGIV